ncbi:lytic transglycosylase [Andreprevotia sp. IGB-42]|uniref:lytic transglycosylase n=1 Tax=Andreprevotia sp. IGB-42 TaxID=2497473 RepID=UPI001358E74B|nr:lytic transglycosylase [Andreprevotia sp. IGB-42]
MDREIYSCKSWFRAKKKSTMSWSEAQARAAHASKQQYTVLVGSVDKPYCFLDVADKVIGVSFLDDHLRESLTYAFQETEPGRLFLTMAIYRKFDGNTDKVVSDTSYLLNPNGTIQIRMEVFNPHHLEISSSVSDISSNYSCMPDFGEYDDLIRVERIWIMPSLKDRSLIRINSH